MDGIKAQMGELNLKVANKDKELDRAISRNDSLIVELNDLKTMLSKSQEAVNADHLETQEIQAKLTAS